MFTNHRTVKYILAAIAVAFVAGCPMDTQDAPEPAPTKAAPPAKVGPLSAARVDALHKFDLDANGELGVAEKARMESQRKARVDALKARIHGGYDRNGNGVLDPDEKQKLQADRDKLSVFKGAALRRYDANHDGVLDRSERQRMLTERQAFLKDVNGKLLAKFDANRDGKLDTQERAAMDQRQPPRTSATK
jgi:hypothetical protein